MNDEHHLSPYEFKSPLLCAQTVACMNSVSLCMLSLFFTRCFIGHGLRKSDGLRALPYYLAIISLTPIEMVGHELEASFSIIDFFWLCFSDECLQCCWWTMQVFPPLPPIQSCFLVEWQLNTMLVFNTIDIGYCTTQCCLLFSSTFYGRMIPSVDQSVFVMNFSRFVTVEQLSRVGLVVITDLCTFAPIWFTDL